MPTRRSVDLSAYPDLVVVYLGYRASAPRGLITLMQIGLGLRRIQAAYPPGLLLHNSSCSARSTSGSANIGPISRACGRSRSTVLIGGLLSSLVLTLFLVPVMYAWVVGFIDRRSEPPRLPGEHQSALDFDDVPPIAAAPPAVPSLTPVHGGLAPLPREGTRASRRDSESAIPPLAMPNLDGTLTLRALGERRHVPLVGLIVVTVVSLRAASRMLRRGDSR